MKPITTTNQQAINSIEIKKPEAAKPLKFNPFDPEFRANPYPIYHRFRSESPIHRINNFTGDEWLVTRYEYVKAVLNDLHFCIDDLPERLKQKSFYLKQHGEFEGLRQTISSWLFFLNPPDHTRLRGIVGKAFSPGVVEDMRPQIQKIVDELIDSVQEDGVMDIIHSLACPLPATVTAMMLGMPTQERNKLIQWAHDLFRVFDQPLSLEVYKHLNQVSLEFKEFLSTLIKEREKSPKQDLLSHLIAAKNQGGKLNEEELMGFCAMLFSVGQETTENFLGNSMLALLRHPDQLQKLKHEPTIIPNAIEELLRYDSPVQLIARIATEDVEIGGKTIKAGDRVHLSLGAANRDPAEFIDPDSIQLTRKHNSIPFGSGIHYCLGGALARLQGQVAINTLIQRLPGLQLSTDKLEWRNNIVLRGLKALPVTFTY
ncbi:cytochrome P450 [Nostoc sp. ChiQUE01b]|uniref:cytochrome P450 n=1 Tax=Nostoc sp. ChiQUE01b TaxID=3075376 RepID=UPI002AD28904|nr:cytochrome P450 [Nostoc sp. ChiQUE01b]MDZ8261970.1 cytochrome P450 [Nostoc sp. ChiQUE01b]